MRPATRRLLAAAGAMAVIGAVVYLDGGGLPRVNTGLVPSMLVAAEPAARDLDPYRGHGAWVDVFDYAPAYQGGGDPPPIAPSVVDEMAAHGVGTVFIQAARNDARSPDGLVDAALLGQFLVRAHLHGMDVVGWYLPTFADVDTDLRHLEAIADFELLGHRFDGVAVDIELTSEVADHGARNGALVELSRRFRDRSAGDAIGAIVLPPVQLEVVNTELWPQFPYRDLAGLYDVWLPMSYWTFRTEASGYRDGYAYNEESTRRLRNNLGDPDAAVHGIGGIGDLATDNDLRGFLRSLVDTGSLGGSIYDWNTLSAAHKTLLAEGFGSGGDGE